MVCMSARKETYRMQRRNAIVCILLPLSFSMSLLTLLGKEGSLSCKHLLTAVTVNVSALRLKFLITKTACVEPSVNVTFTADCSRALDLTVKCLRSKWSVLEGNLKFKVTSKEVSAVVVMDKYLASRICGVLGISVTK